MPRSDTAEVVVPSTTAARRDVRDAVLDAQLLGQGGARRGLRGGEPVLKSARAAYLSTQWRGEDDRRPPPGLLRRVSA